MSFVQLLLGAGVAMLATVLGAAGVAAFNRISSRAEALTMAFSAGMMAFSAFEMVDESHGLVGHRMALAALVTGLLVFLILDRIMPHAHLFLMGNEMPTAKKKAALLAGTITLHNIPEGVAIASAFADSSSLGWLVAISIALQDIPEGLIVAAPLACYGLSRRRSFFWGAFSGLVEMLAAIGAFFVLRTASAALPFALAFSGGAMSYVVLFELMPDALHGQNRFLVASTFVGGIAIAYSLSLVIGR
jgi:zinc transporter, ZIP family